MAAIKFIYFDLGNVLLKFDHEIACVNLAKLTNSTPTRIREIVFSGGLEDAYERGEVSTEEFYEKLCQATNSRPDLREVCRGASNIFQQNHPVVAIVAALRRAGNRLGVLSNTCEAHWEFVANGRHPFLNKYFEQIILSYEVRSMKPDRKIYEEAVKAAGVAPQEVFFMDDRPDNVAGAVAAGIHAVLFEDSTKLIKDLVRAKVPLCL